MKKFINPEMKIAVFDIENIVTDSATAAEVAQEELQNGGSITVNGTTYDTPQAVVITF